MVETRFFRVLINGIDFESDEMEQHQLALRIRTKDIDGKCNVKLVPLDKSLVSMSTYINMAGLIDICYIITQTEYLSFDCNGNLFARVDKTKLGDFFTFHGKYIVCRSNLWLSSYNISFELVGRKKLTKQQMLEYFEWSSAVVADIEKWPHIDKKINHLANRKPGISGILPE